MSRRLQDVQDFIVLNRLDASAARCLQSEASGIQKAVLGRGVLSGCSNPSSAVMGRIRDAKHSFRSAVAQRDMALDTDMELIAEVLGLVAPRSRRLQKLAGSLDGGCPHRWNIFFGSATWCWPSEVICCAAPMMLRS